MGFDMHKDDEGPYHGVLHVGVDPRLLRVDTDLDRIVDTPAKVSFHQLRSNPPLVSHLLTGTRMCNRLATVGRIARSAFPFFEYTFLLRSKRGQRRVCL